MKQHFYTFKRVVKIQRKKNQKAILKKVFEKKNDVMLS